MGGWDAVAASVSGVNPAAYGTQRGGRLYQPVLKPTQYTDNTLITVPVLETATSTSNINSNEASTDQPRKLGEKEKGPLGFFRRKVLNFDDLSNTPVNVTIRQIPNKEYQKHYIKDDHGRYMGTEAPADDCILSAEDTARWRGEGAEGVRQASFSAADDVEPTGVLDDVDYSGRAQIYTSDTAPLPPRPEAKKRAFGRFKSSRGDSRSPEIVR